MYSLGVDVGTSSVRVGLFDSSGRFVSIKIKEINVHNSRPNFYEQSSEDIWSACCDCIREILTTSGVDSNDIKSVGFDATCSLVVLDEHYKPVTVSPDVKSDNLNIIMWMDHRAEAESEFINSTSHNALRSVGGQISIEMDPPKISWLKNNMKESFNRAVHFFSLPDYLVWRSSGASVRSVCTTTCKWLWDSPGKKWDESFWRAINLSELLDQDCLKIGSRVCRPFEFLPEMRISEQSATETGLTINCKVGVSMIDAHAGGIGALALTYGFVNSLEVERRSLLQLTSLEAKDILVLVSGTSACFMSTTEQACYIPGVWGPYYEAMVPGMWLNEAGQSTCGKLIDLVVQTHPKYQDLLDVASRNQMSIYQVLDQIILEKEGNTIKPEMIKSSVNLHIYPDFHGNRSPLSDSSMTGSISGLSLSFGSSIDDLALMYLSALFALAYQSKHIIETLNQQHKLIVVIGGLGRNQLYSRLICDVTQIPVLVIGDCSEWAVLFGAAILGASNLEENQGLSFDNLIKRFGGNECKDDVKILSPHNELNSFHARKYQVYKSMIDDQRKYQAIMKL